jgi:hypothetical protein
LQNNKTQTSPHNHGPVQGGAHDPNNLSGPSGIHPGHPSGRSPPRSRVARPLGQIFALLEGYPHPRADLRLARGLYAPSPSSASPSRLGVLQVRKPHTHSPERSIKHSDMPRALESKANPHHDGPLTPPGNHTPAMFHQPSLRGHPCHCTGLCSKASVNSVTLCHPLPYSLRTAPLETGLRNPREGYGRLPRARMGRHRDVRPVERVSSITVNPVWPSPPLCHHHEHYSPIPGAMGTQGDKTSPRPPLCNLQPSVSLTLELTHRGRLNKRLSRHHTRNRSWTSTGLTMTPARSKIRQDDHPLRGTVHHTAICSFRVVQYDCKPPPLGL